jgi:thymidylate kinase
MIYVFEGPDKVGKTTLAKKFAHYAGLNYYKPLTKILWAEEYANRLTPEERAAYLMGEFETLIDFTKNIYEDKNIVFDRFFTSEIIYQKIFRTDVNFNYDYLRDLERTVIENDNMRFVYVTAPIEFILSKFHEEEIIEPSFIKSIYSGYKNYFENETTLPFIKVNSPIDLTDENMEKLETMLEFSIGNEEWNKQMVEFNQ